MSFGETNLWLEKKITILVKIVSILFQEASGFLS